MSLADEKLQKVLARAGLGSRREMERVISDGRVSVNGKTATLGDRVTSEAKIKVDGKPVKAAAAKSAMPRVLLYNKPEGEICSRKDPEGRRSVFDRLPALQGERWVCVGRLDFNTTGLLLFTTDGELANKLMHPSTVIEREYLCRVMGNATEENLQSLVDGVQLDDGVAKFTDVVDGGGEGINHWYYVVIMEGRNREVRRLWESQGLQVNRLKRVRYGSVFIPSKVKVGQWTELNTQEISDIYGMANMEMPVLETPVATKTRRHDSRKR
ncbi:pseudouridine synthase family protein [Spongiibacter sp. IMCC21906]|jgi:23S rRNA pseudouridine2605 synthase|uniref:23S rRNA pseudouridine(2605) synthase RluB n=1 Tax=Spongiibacter sp. IMCC21906 TaxID=1620392 RepID=UPI00062DD93F|nr:23S rRNA pseudouridine(2605) synthase RluB [Spongiibacter sp. IMCC21906]AKH69912.1 pseudouridine synthase family protein [Spongiibacter sp. IMCC21906]